MENLENKDPIIITGMHRSGTSLLTNFLSDCGVFMGKSLDENYESVFFQRINKWILSCVGSSWDNPVTLKKLGNKDIEIILNRLEKVINSRFSNSLYFGKRSFLSNKSFNQNNLLWGWKDPVNTFSLVIWKKVFPAARVINISRHPLDVSLSLINREKILKNKDVNSMFPKFLSSLLPILSVSKGDVLSSFNISSINDALLLCKKYNEEMLTNNKTYPDIFNIKYEDMISNPSVVFDSLFKFLNLKLNEQKKKKYIKKMDKSKIFAYKNKDLEFNKQILEDIDY